MSPITIRVKPHSYEFVGLRGGRRTILAILRNADLGLSIEVADLRSEEEGEIRRKAAGLEEILRNRTGQLAIGLIRNLGEFEASPGSNGPGDAEVALEALETALRNALRKVQRTNELAVRMGSRSAAVAP